MKAYRDKTGDLDQLYEKNVSRFLGTRRKVNAAIKRTLEEEPESFCLYNNGVTIPLLSVSENHAQSKSLRALPHGYL